MTVGEGHPPYIIAEVGSNHNGDMDLCRRLIDAAAEAGAHAVKFQSWSESSLIASEEYDRNPEYSDKKKHFGSLREMVRAYQFTPDQHREALAHCRDRGIAFCSSAFSPEEVDLLDELDVPFIKIASMDITNLPLLTLRRQEAAPGAHLRRDGHPRGDRAGGGDRPRAGKRADRPAPLHLDLSSGNDTIHLRNMATLRDAFDVPVGFSDHTLGTSIPLAAIALGACIIEKHFTLDKDMAGWDHAISADPAEMRDDRRRRTQSLSGAREHASAR